MPSSRPNTIPTVLNIVRQLQPRSILDVGIGFGKWGHLFREYTDILAAESEPARYQRQNWKITIDGIEGYPAYVTEMHRFLYNHIHIGDARDLIKSVPGYDLIFFGDIIEHFEKKEGLEILRTALAKANQAVLLTTPKFETAQEELCGNALEQHRSLWRAADFRPFEGAITKTIDKSILLALLLKPGVTPPVCAPPRGPDPVQARRYLRAKKLLARLVPHDAPFILIDEEQLRHSLPHKKALPFLEKDGVYWGIPLDDATTLQEVQRMQLAGAQYLAVIFSCFWWLEHFPSLKSHLEANARCLHQDDTLKFFALDRKTSV